jgi:hypothetical protein
MRHKKMHHENANLCEAEMVLLFKSMLVILFISSSSFTTENLQLDEGYFRRMSGMTIFFINFHFLQFLLILIFIFTIFLFI